MIVMLRGRHRGLPAAIDRAIMLPYDLGLDDENATRGGKDNGEKTIINQKADAVMEARTNV